MKQRIGQPSGKAVVFGHHLGSNPSAPANKMKKILENLHNYQ